MKIEVKKKLICILVLIIIYINIFNGHIGYISYYPTIPVYPNNNTDLEIMKKEMANRSEKDIDFFFKTNDSVVYAFLPYINDADKDIEHLKKIITSQNNIILFFKYGINRRRPYQIDKELNPLALPITPTPAYPAGHAYQAMLLAKYLSKKYPEKKELFYNIALKCDECRVKAGIHYKSDGEFARKLFNIFN